MRTRRGHGHTDARKHPNHTKLIECEACWAKLWVHPNTKSGYCETCRMVLFGDNKASSYYKGAAVKPTSAKPPRTAFDIRDSHRKVLFQRATS